MASCRMLTHLLRSDHITYQICPVLNIEELEYTYKNFITTDIKTIFLLNCGAVMLGYIIIIFDILTYDRLFLLYRLITFQSCLDSNLVGKFDALLLITTDQYI